MQKENQRKNIVELFAIALKDRNIINLGVLDFDNKEDMALLYDNGAFTRHNIAFSRKIKKAYPELVYSMGTDKSGVHLLLDTEKYKGYEFETKTIEEEYIRVFVRFDGREQVALTRGTIINFKKTGKVIQVKRKGIFHFWKWRTKSALQWTTTCIEKNEVSYIDPNGQEVIEQSDYLEVQGLIKLFTEEYEKRQMLPAPEEGLKKRMETYEDKAIAAQPFVQLIEEDERHG